MKKILFLAVFSLLILAQGIFATEENNNVHVYGSGYNYPVPFFLASLSLDVDTASLDNSWLVYYYTRNRILLVSTSITNVEVVGNNAIINGIGTVNNNPDYTFTTTITDGNPDKIKIMIYRPDGTLYFSASSKNVFRGNYNIESHVCQVYDDFESGTDDKWMNQNGNWNVVNDGGNYVYRQNEYIGGGSHWMGAVADFNGQNYSAETDMRYTEMGDFGMALSIYSSSDKVVIASTPEFISVTIFPRFNQFSLYIKDKDSPTREYSQGGISFEKNKWYHVRIEVNNGFVSAFLDNEKVISNIPTNLVGGYLSLSTDDIKADFDNVIICQE